MGKNAMSSTPVTIDAEPSKPVQSMRGKYDKRGKHGNYDTEARRNRPQVKPAWAKNLSRNQAAKILHTANFQEKALELLNCEDLRLRWDVIKYLWDRFEGKAFVAQSPTEASKGESLKQDNRLQVAIQQLILQPPSKQRKAKAIAKASTQALCLPADTASEPAAEPEPNQAAENPGGGAEK
jgi:hypothetical protein